ncbi:RagB/SusD family nutrient uptake outer membrane protein [Oceanihabitans sp. 2_MG-2023]|uniref:RagB/SusD family nutrient uptake outer membrane protein n=1 Tax=Oceanihabitans sp. 2_MG-2023 TaxID=3062661 RepID=UPI0026E41D8F|nr:RagB/SusD family nutrient uptake outer membrane protein [Oceanihabitans sp. 2_MG-2023]MDO6597941.1 RagB/SusD family nutrient uptake outer membrane protein [Oceanihabitans sp. 2_MG-2023]
MKKSLIIGLFFIAIFSVSCEDYLVEEPRTLVSISNFYQTESDARTAADAMYHALHDGTATSIYGRYWPQIDLATDDAINRRFYPNWATHQVTSIDEWLENNKQYQGLWVGVARANDVLKYVPQVDMDEDGKNAILAEAHALRAFCYFQLARVWGDLPLVVNSVTTETDYNLPRSSVDEVYNQIIIPDLQFAEEFGADELQAGRLTKWSAKVILADVYLTRAGWSRTSQGDKVQGDASNWALASAKAKEVLDSSPHSLITVDFVDGEHTTPACGVPWLEDYPFSVESMFELASTNLGGLGSYLSRECVNRVNGRFYWGAGNNNTPLIDEGIELTIVEMGWTGGTTNGGTLLVSPDLYSAFDEPGDKRRDWGIVTRYNAPDGRVFLSQPQFRKYMDMGFFTDDGNGDVAFQRTNNNFILYRYADALLIFAEAENEANGPTIQAHDALNEIRNRAGLPSLTGLSQSEFRTAVLKERRLELHAEAKRRFDLIRTDGFTEMETDLITVWGIDQGSQTDIILNSNYGSAPWPDREWLLPIPESEMNLNSVNGWEQNEGY